MKALITEWELIAVEENVIFYAFMEDIFRPRIILCKGVKKSIKEGFRAFKHQMNYKK